MGNSAFSGSSGAKVQQLLKSKYTLSSATISDDTLRAALSDIGLICNDFRDVDLAKTIGSKEIKFGLQIVNELVDACLQSSLQLPMRLCILEALQSVIALPAVCRRAIDGEGVARLLVALAPANAELFIGTLGVILQVFRAIEDENTNALFFQSLVKSGCVQKFFLFVTQASVAGSDNMLCGSIVILDIVYWSFSRAHAVLQALRPAVRHVAFQHRDSLFELSRHPVRKLSYLTTMLLIRLMASADKVTCIAIQVSYTLNPTADTYFLYQRSVECRPVIWLGAVDVIQSCGRPVLLLRWRPQLRRQIRFLQLSLHIYSRCQVCGGLQLFLFQHGRGHCQYRDDTSLAAAAGHVLCRQ